MNGRQEYNIIDYGADPTGSADSRDAIYAAMVDARRTKGYVFIPPGDFKVNTGIGTVNRSLFLASGDTLIGTGRASRLFKAPAQGGNLSDRPMFFQLDGANPVNDIYMGHFQCDGLGSVNSNGVTALIRIGSTMGGDNIELDSLFITDVPAPGMFAVYISATTAPNVFTNVRIHHCLIDHCGRDAIHLISCTDVILADNQIYTGTATATGDDQVAIQGVTQLVISGNIIANTSEVVGGAGRNLWIDACDDVTIANNEIYNGYRSGILISGASTDIDIHGNLIADVGILQNVTSRGDAINLEGPASAAIRNVNIRDNTFISPRRNAIAFTIGTTLANQVYDQVSIKDNNAYTDRSAAWLLTLADAGHFVFCDASVRGDAIIDQLSIESNTSVSEINEAIYLKGVNIVQPRMVNERHYECGRVAPDQKASYYLESLAQFEMRGCIGRDRSGASQTDYGARFINLNAGSGGVRGRVSDCDFLDTVNANVVWNPAGAPTAWIKANNFGAAALP